MNINKINETIQDKNLVLHLRRTTLNIGLLNYGTLPWTHFNPYMTNGLTHHYDLGESTLILWGFRYDFKIPFHMSHVMSKPTMWFLNRVDSYSFMGWLVIFISSLRTSGSISLKLYEGPP